MSVTEDITKKYQSLFLGTAIYNWSVAISMLKPAGTFEAMHISPIPAQDNTLHTCCVCIGGFGFIYYWASQDLPANYDLVWLGMALKAGNIAFAIFDIWVGTITWQLLLLLAPDMILVIIFYNVLGEVKKQQALSTKTN